MDYSKRGREIIECEIDGLRMVRDGLGDQFNAAVTTILECLENSGKIVVTGMGKNLHIAQKISATLASTGSTSVVLNPSQAMHGDLGILTKGDVLLTLSYSGESDELTAMLPAASRLHVTIITMTGVPDSSLAEYSDIIIPVTVPKEACPFNMAPTTSTTATLAAGDALAITLLEARGFRKEDYATLHPAGAIGRALLMRVSDLMRTNDRLAVIDGSSSVKDALLAMTKARSGSVCVLNSEGSLAGIFTDGDLRRHIAEHENILQMPIEKMMTPSPLTIKPNQLAVDILKIFEDRNIDDLVVVDDNNRPVGAIDIQDLPKAKIM